MGNTIKGSLYFYNVSTGKLKLFAGADEKTKFVDGPNAMFFEPRRLDYSNGYLYVLDYNVIRRVSMDSAYQAVTSETLAGKVTADQHPETINGKGSDVTFAPSYLMDTVVMSIGTSPNPLIKDTTNGLEVNARGGIIVNEEGLTSRESVYAGGDAVTGAATVISAMGAGKTAAKAIDDYLMNN